MSKLVLIRGLDRGGRTSSGFTASDSSVDSVRGFKGRAALGRAYTAGVKASYTTALTGANNDLKFTARYGGTYANNITLVYVDPSGNNKTLSVVVTYASTTGYPVITVNLATNGGGTITSTGAQILAAINGDPTASQWVIASLAASNDGTGVVTAMSSQSLASGTNVGTDAEPPYGVVGEPIYIKVVAPVSIVVDTDDPNVGRVLRRNHSRYISLGAV